MSYSLTSMAFGDVRIVTFLFNRWLLPNDIINGTPTVKATAPLISATFISSTTNSVTCSVTAGNFTGTGQLSCAVQTADGEKATRTVAIPVVASTS